MGIALSDAGNGNALTLDDVRQLLGHVDVSVVRRSDGEVIENVTILRYAGEFGGVSAFAIKNGEGKFVVRGAGQLGLTKDSPYSLHQRAA